jgi:hypothetical protein
MTTLTYDTDLFAASAVPTAAIAASALEATASRAGWFQRMMEAVGRTYYIETPDGEGYYLFPPC